MTNTDSRSHTPPLPPSGGTTGSRANASINESASRTRADAAIGRVVEGGQSVAEPSAGLREIAQVPTTPAEAAYTTQQGVRVDMFDGHPVRTGGNPRNPWFVVIDILRALDDDWYEGKRYNVTEAIKGLDPEEFIKNELPDAQGLMQQTGCVFKSGVFFLVGKSNKPSAQKFQRWVRKEVLVEIDETGSYNGGAQLTVQGTSPKPMAPIGAIATVLLNVVDDVSDLRERLTTVVAHTNKIGQGVISMVQHIEGLRTMVASQRELISAAQARIDRVEAVQTQLCNRTDVQGGDKRSQVLEEHIEPMDLSEPEPPTEQDLYPDDEHWYSVSAYMEENAANNIINQINRSLLGRRAAKLFRQFGREPEWNIDTVTIRLLYPAWFIKEACRQIILEKGLATR